MPIRVLRVVQGDITEQSVDAIVNAANSRMRGGGGVDGAIHRAGGAAILRDCVARFPDGLAVGDAGFTTGGDLPARWVIHTVGPDRRAGQIDPELLASCYRRSLAVAAELGVRTVSFPLVGAGVFGWALGDAVQIAVDTIAAFEGNGSVEDVTIVAHDQSAFEHVGLALARNTPVLILEGVRVLHERGYHRVRIRSGLAPSGMYWRIHIAVFDGVVRADPEDWNDWGGAGTIVYSTGAGVEFASGEVSIVTTPESVADLMLSRLPDARPSADDPDYVAWFRDLLRVLDEQHGLPVSYADYYTPKPGWYVGWGDDRLPDPPAVPGFEGE